MAFMTRITLDNAPAIRIQGRFLGWACWGFLPLVLMFTVGTIIIVQLAGASLTNEPITRAAYDAIPGIGFRQAAVSWLLLLPMALAAAGSVHAARRVRGVLGVVSIALWTIVVGATIVYAYCYTASNDFTTPTVLEDPNYVASMILFGFVVMPLSFIATAATALCLRVEGVAPRGTRIVAGVSVVAGLVYAVARGWGEVPVPPAIVVGVWIPLAIWTIRAAKRAPVEASVPGAAPTTPGCEPAR